MTTPIDAAGIVAALVKPLVWEGGLARSTLGDLYEVVRLSENVWQVLKNGTAIYPWDTDRASCIAAAEADYRTRIAAALDVGKVVTLITEAQAACEWQVSNGRGRFATLEDALAAFKGASHG